MINVIFTASVVRKDRGVYVAHAEEFPIAAAPASTQRGAVKNLKAAVLLRLRQAAETGALTDFLDDAGYTSELTFFNHQIKLESNILDSETVSVALPSQLINLDRSRRPTTGEERT